MKTNTNYSALGTTSLLFLFHLCLLSGATSWAQTPQQFLTYENPDFNIRIQYPGDWIKFEENLNRYQVVAFSAPEIEQSQTSLSSIVFTPANFFVSVIPVSSQNIGLQQFVDQLLNETYSTAQDYRIIYSSQTTFAGTNNALSMVMYEYATDKTSKVMRNIALQNGTAYMIKYAAEPGLYDDYLPIAQRMSDSLEIGNTTLKPIQSINSSSVASTAPVVENQTTQPIATLNATENGQQEQPLSPQSLPLPQPPSNTATGISSLPQTIVLSDNVFGETLEKSTIPVIGMFPK
jgi:hypothetical protein